MSQHVYGAKKRIGEVEVEFSSTDLEAVKAFINEDFGSNKNQEVESELNTHWALATFLDGESVGTSHFPSKQQAETAKLLSKKIFESVGMKPDFTMFEVSGTIVVPYAEDSEGNIVTQDEAAALWKEALENA